MNGKQILAIFGVGFLAYPLFGWTTMARGLFNLVSNVRLCVTFLMFNMFNVPFLLSM